MAVWSLSRKTGNGRDMPSHVARAHPSIFGQSYSSAQKTEPQIPSLGKHIFLPNAPRLGYSLWANALLTDGVFFAMYNGTCFLVGW